MTVWVTEAGLDVFLSVYITVLLDGWAVAQIRAQKSSLTKAGFDVCPEFATRFYHFQY